MKKLIIFLLTMGLTLTVQANKNIEVKLNGNTLTFDQPPIEENGRIFVPMRAIFEAMGYSVYWDEKSQEIHATGKEYWLFMKVGNTDINRYTTEQIKNNESPTTIPNDVAPQIVNDRTLVPVRAISECLNCDVSWDENTQTVLISNKVEPVPQNGYGKEYYSPGKIMYEGNFKNGNWAGQGKLYAQNGHLTYEGNFADNKKSGQGKLFYESGKVAYDGNWADSLRNGYGKMYYENGNLFYEGYFKDDEFHGQGKVYDEKGTLIYEGLSENGKPVGANSVNAKTYSQALYDLNEKYYTLIKDVQDNYFKSEEAEAIRKSYGVDSNALANIAADNSGNIDSFAAANALRQKKAFIDAANESILKWRNAKIQNLKDAYALELSQLKLKYNVQ